MSALISALDNHVPTQFGENGTLENTWANTCNYQESITQLSFQLTRTRDANTLNNLSRKTDELLSSLTGAFKMSKISREEYLMYMSYLFRMIGQTRDIVDGKGEYELSYMLLEVWNKHHPRLAEFAFGLFLRNDDKHPYGSWKDLKGFYKRHKNSSLVAHGSKLLLEQLRKDAISETPSLAAKWVPREKSQHSELFEKLALNYFSNYLETAKTASNPDVAKQLATKKAKMDFRKLISHLNKKLDTVQIKQCDSRWASIDPAKQTSITMSRQRKAFLNLKKYGTQRMDNCDRQLCAKNFTEFAEKAKKGEVKVNGKRTGMDDFTKQALELIAQKHYSANEPSSASVETEIALLDSQWNNNSLQTSALGKMIAMVDVSGSMMGDPMHCAIALGIRVAEKSMLGKRVLTFSTSPRWVNLDDCDGFVSMVDKLRVAPWGGNTDFHSALTLILNAITKALMKPEDVEDMVLAIFSDMQMDQAGNHSETVMQQIDTMYAEAGMRLWNKPYKAPHILFWNLNSTSGFPTLSSKRNCSMMSGFSPALLNLFCEQGLEALQSCTPWSLLVKSLENERYNPLDEMLRATL